MPGHLFEGNPVDEGTTGRSTDAPVHLRKNPQVPHTSRKVVSSFNNLRCKLSSIPPQNTRPDTPEQTQQGPCDLSQIRPPGSQDPFSAGCYALLTAAPSGLSVSLKRLER